MTLMSLLVAVIVICLLFWAIQTLTAAFGVPPQVKAVLMVLLVVLVVIWLIGGLDGIAPLRLR